MTPHPRSRVARARRRLCLAGWVTLSALLGLTATGLAQAQTRTQVDQAVRPLEQLAEDPAAVVGEAALRHARDAEAVVAQARAQYAESYDQITQRGRAIVEQALQRPPGTLADTSSATPTPPRSALPIDGRGYRLFLSQSMPETDLRTAARLAAADPRLVLVFRGFKPGQTLLQLAGVIQGLLEAPTTPDAFPRIEIDPPQFLEANVTAAPTLVAYQEGAVLASVQGVFRTQWLEDRLGPGRGGDLGTRGPTYPVIEQDLMQLLQERVRTVQDEQRGRGQALFESYFDSLQYQTLSLARRDRTRRIDPTVVVQQTLRTPNGVVIAEAGTRVNPLDHVPFPGRVFVFDATDEAQRAFIKAQIDAQPDGAITLVSTRLSSDEPAKHFGRLQEDFGRRVTLLNPELVARFQLQHVPAVIHADATHYIVDEFGPARTRATPPREG